MARPDHLFVFAYDIWRDRDRAKVAELLETRLTRVQDSLFEGRLPLAQAHALADQAAALIDEGDSLRVYCLTEAGRRASLAYGPPPLAEAADFWLA